MQLSLPYQPKVFRSQQDGASSTSSWNRHHPLPLFISHFLALIRYQIDSNTTGSQKKMVEYFEIDLSLWSTKWLEWSIMSMVVKGLTLFLTREENDSVSQGLGIVLPVLIAVLLLDGVWKLKFRNPNNLRTYNNTGRLFCFQYLGFLLGKILFQVTKEAGWLGFATRQIWD